MIMRITWGKLRPGSWNQFESTYNTTVAAKGRNVKGLRGRWLLQDTDDKDTGFAVSLWERAADMRAYEQSEFYQKEILAPLLDDKRELSGFTIPMRVCDRAAEAISHTSKDNPFDSDWGVKRKDEQIAKLKQYCKESAP